MMQAPYPRIIDIVPHDFRYRVLMTFRVPGGIEAETVNEADDFEIACGIAGARLRPEWSCNGSRV